MQEYFKVNGVRIKTPTEYRPVFATTSTPDSDRTQDMIMHNTPMGTVEGYDMSWESLTFDEMQTILHGMVNRSSFAFHYASPYRGGWVDGQFYASNFSMDTQSLKEDVQKWTGLSINVRSINPI